MNRFFFQHMMNGIQECKLWPFAYRYTIRTLSNAFCKTIDPTIADILPIYLMIFKSQWEIPKYLYQHIDILFYCSVCK